jgi:hypothetical protein
MARQVSVVVFALFVVMPASAGDIVTRAEKTDLRNFDGKVVSRVERDAAGDVTQLLLNDMKVSQEEVAELEKLPKLRSVVFFRTNLDDEGLKRLRGCARLESLSLTGTGISDDAIKVILEFKNLKYLCLGNVNVSPEAVKMLKEGFRSRGQDVHLGYSRRK